MARKKNQVPEENQRISTPAELRTKVEAADRVVIRACIEHIENEISGWNPGKKIIVVMPQLKDVPDEQEERVLTEIRRTYEAAGWRVVVDTTDMASLTMEEAQPVPEQNPGP